MRIFTLLSYSVLTLLTFWLCGCDTQKEQPFRVSIQIPQAPTTGISFFEYVVENDTLYAVTKQLDNTFDTLSKSGIDPSSLQELKHLLVESDTLGFHSLNSIQSVKPRFMIFADYDGKSHNGYISGCYRAPIFNIIDWFNENYLEGNVLIYNKDFLLNREEKKDEFKLDLKNKLLD